MDEIENKLGNDGAKPFRKNPWFVFFILTVVWALLGFVVIAFGDTFTAMWVSLGFPVIALPGFLTVVLLIAFVFNPVGNKVTKAITGVDIRADYLDKLYEKYFKI